MNPSFVIYVNRKPDQESNIDLINGIRRCNKMLSLIESRDSLPSVRVLPSNESRPAGLWRMHSDGESEMIANIEVVKMLIDIHEEIDLS